MTLPTANPGTGAGAARSFRRWFRSKDPDLLVLKRSVRAAVIMPLVFAIAHVAFSNPQVALFGAFGSFALLLLVEFTGPPRSRLVSYGGLYLVGACFTVLGTLVSTHKVAAVVTMAVVGFAVLFTGIVAPQAATASTAALLTFVLSRGRGPAGVRHRSSPHRLDARRRLLHHGLHGRVAASVA